MPDVQIRKEVQHLPTFKNRKHEEARWHISAAANPQAKSHQVKQG